MNIELSKQTIEMAVDACIVQNSGSMESIDVRSAIAQRLTYHVGEHVCAKVKQLLQDRKLIPNETLPSQPSGGGNKSKNGPKQC